MRGKPQLEIRLLYALTIIGSHLFLTQLGPWSLLIRQMFIADSFRPVNSRPSYLLRHLADIYRRFVVLLCLL